MVDYSVNPIKLMGSLPEETTEEKTNNVNIYNLE